jgi:tRNA pseudouridine38-40 synthase
MGSCRNWKLVLAYDGTPFHGWQVQPHLPTVQGSLADALERITGECVLPQGSGRTDAGVHALGQVASFVLEAPIPPANLHRALNRTLPESIRVLSVEHAPPEFHARHSATGKSYEYRIFRGDVCPPWLSRYVYALNWPLDLERMRRAAALVVGIHDFTSFAAADPDLNQRSHPDEESSNVRLIRDSGWQVEGDLLTYRVRGSGFLHHMVRNLVGTFLEIGRSAVEPEEISTILAARDRQFAGPTAPARGLFLAHVEYDSSTGEM